MSAMPLLALAHSRTQARMEQVEVTRITSNHILPDIQVVSERLRPHQLVVWELEAAAREAWQVRLQVRWPAVLRWEGEGKRRRMMLRVGLWVFQRIMPLGFGMKSMETKMGTSVEKVRRIRLMDTTPRLLQDKVCKDLQLPDRILLRILREHRLSHRWIRTVKHRANCQSQCTRLPP